jgi:hypothetical protein
VAAGIDRDGHAGDAFETGESRRPVFQDSEIVTLLFMLATLPVLPSVLRGLELPGLPWFVAGYLCMAGAYVCTIAEGFVWPEALNLLEHLGYAGSGACILRGVIYLVRARRRELGA